MASKFAAIQAQLERAGGSKRPPAAPQPVAVAPPAPAAPAVPAKSKAPSREGKIHIGAYLHPDFKRSLRMVQAQTGQDMQALLALALNDLFRGHNVPVIDAD
ncbi:MAG: ribbon-helix-helix domain-containing protein [Beijerinckiaceae bacterium]